MAVRMAKNVFCKVFPPDFTAKRVYMKDIVKAGILRDAYVQGVIETAHPVQYNRKCKVCKLVLHDYHDSTATDTDDTLMNAFFFGEIAEQCKSAQKGDVIVFKDVAIELSPVSTGHKFQLIIKRERSTVSVWFISGHNGKRRVWASEYSATEDQQVDKNDPAKKQRFALESSESEDSQESHDKENTSITVSSSLEKQSRDPQAKQRKTRRVRLGPRGMSPSVGENAVLQNVVCLDRDTPVTRSMAAASGDKEMAQHGVIAQGESSEKLSVPIEGHELQNLVVQIDKISTSNINVIGPSTTTLLTSSSSNSQDDNNLASGELSPVLLNETDSRCSEATAVPGTPSGHFSPPTIRRSLDSCVTSGSPPQVRTSAPVTGQDSSAAALLPQGDAFPPDRPESATDNQIADVPQNDANISSQLPSAPDATYTVPAGYTKLAALKVNSVVNVFGVVKFFKPPWKSRGTDMCSVVLLMDPSLPQSNEETGFECVMFQANRTSLPQILSVGDVVRLHRVKVNSFNGRLQAKSSKGFAAVVFDRDPSLAVSEQTARVSSSTFTFSPEDKELVQKLKNYSVSRQDLFQPGLCCTVAEITPSAYFDLVCQVMAVAYHQALDCVVLRVSDGTKLVNETRKYGADTFKVVSSQPSDMPSVDIYLFGEHAAIVKHCNVNAGLFVKLHNVHAQVYQLSVGASLLDELNPTLELCVHRGTAYGRGLTLLSADSSEVKVLMDRMQQQANGN